MIPKQVGYIRETKVELSPKYPNIIQEAGNIFNTVTLDILFFFAPLLGWASIAENVEITIDEINHVLKKFG